MVVSRGTKSRVLYTTTLCINIATIAESASSSSLWYNKLGHINVKIMKMLAAKEVIESFKFIDMSLCESYVMGKKNRISFTTVAKELKKVRLEMVHTNIWGPSPISSLG